VSDWDFREFDENDPEATKQCPDCNGYGGRVREVFGRLSFCTCIHCAGYGYVFGEPEDDEQDEESI
jgi:DnaJ-class molecular chaperone